MQKATTMRLQFWWKIHWNATQLNWKKRLLSTIKVIFLLAPLKPSSLNKQYPPIPAWSEVKMTRSGVWFLLDNRCCLSPLTLRLFLALKSETPESFMFDFLFLLDVTVPSESFISEGESDERVAVRANQVIPWVASTGATGVEFTGVGSTNTMRNGVGGMAELQLQYLRNTTFY